MFRQRRGGPTTSIEPDKGSHPNGSVTASAVARPLAAAVEDRGKGNLAASASAGRRVSLPAVSWSMAWGKGARSRRGSRGSRGGLSGEGAPTPHSGEHGMTDFRLIPRWSFFTQPIREPEEKLKTSIGTLYVKVVEGRGLMASDLNGRSDPYVKLCLTGRYLSNGQEWSEKLRLRETTKIIKYSLNPVWDEEFSMPVRRSGAVLKIEVWDWDRSSADDPLGHFEVSIGEELLCQQPLDMWYVLEAPRGRAAAAQAAAEKKLRKQQQQQQQQQAGLANGSKAKPSQGGDVDGEHGSSIDDMGDTDNGPYNDNDNDNNDDDEPPDSPDNENGYPARSLGERSVSSKAVFRRRSSAAEYFDHSHETEEEMRACEICIKQRRKLFGEVRLVLWYQYDEFAEMCSHTWPEEPLKQGKIHFSPNELYRKGMVCWQMAQPYVGFMKEADAIMCWVRPWRSLLWMVALVAMFMVPPFLIVVINGALMRIVVTAYLKHRSGGGEGYSGGRDAISSAEGSTSAAAAAAAAAAAGAAAGAPAPAAASLGHASGSGTGHAASSSSSSLTLPASSSSLLEEERADAFAYASSSHREGVLGVSPGESGKPILPSTPTTGRRRSSVESLEFSPAAFSSGWPPPSPSPTGDVFGNSVVAGSGGAEGLRSAVSAEGYSFSEAASDMSIATSTRSQANNRGPKRFSSLSRPMPSRGGQPRRTSSDPDPAAASAAAAAQIGYSTGGGGVRTSSSAPSWYPSWGTSAPGPAPASALTALPASAPSSTPASSSGAAPPTPSKPSAPGTTGSAKVSASSDHSHQASKTSVAPVKARAAGAVAKGGKGMKSAAEAGGMKIKNLLPTRRDPELQELYTRLGNTKKVPAVVNEVGKRLLSKSGPSMQRGFEKMGRNLIQIRQRFHPLQVKELVVAMTALVLHMVLQLWLYLTGRFNLYFVLLVVGQFTNKLYKRWGKAFVAAIKEARRSHRTRLTLTHRMSTAAAATPSHPDASVAARGHQGPYSSDKVVPNPFRFDSANPPAFAPPGTTPAVEPYPALGVENAAQQASTLSTTSISTSFFARSPTRRKSNSGGSGTAITNVRDGGVGSLHGLRGGVGSGSGNGRVAPHGPRGSASSSPTRPRSMGMRSETAAASGFSASRVAASEGSRSVRGVSRRWSLPWGKRAKVSGGGGGARGGNPPGDGMTLYEERRGAVGGHTGGGGLSSLALPPRLRSGVRSGKRATRRRVRWARVFGASVSLACALTALTAAVSSFLFPAEDGLELPLPLIPLWQGFSGLGLFLLWRGEGDGATLGAEMTAAWRSRLERFSFGVRGGQTEDEGEEEEEDGDGRGEAADDDAGKAAQPPP
eukprot:g6953.t1